jgi:EAL domain-containing protein (putative c-di-GMP-specific phosphodiesterase class I)/GGDEF domain-containing protein
MHRPPEKLAGLMLGQLDSFNRISTTFGADESREFCADYAESLRDILPKGSPVIRLSGRRFAILVSPDSEAEIADLAAIIAEAHQPEMRVGDDSFNVDVKLGVALCPLHADDATSLYRRADLALKNAQDNDLSFDIYRPDATKQQATLWKLESDLKRAIADGDLHVHYQPKVRLAGHSVSGIEALVRWTTEDGRALSPETFIPLAESTGSIVPLTWLVFERSLQAVRSWPAFEEPFSLAINVSPQSANHPEFCDRLKTLKEELAKSNVRLGIELTEDSLLKGDDKSLANLHRIRELDVDLAIDDFGKGYSSLTYLKEVPATEIKIDKKFIETIGLDETDQQIVKAVINLAHALGMQVVAEGVDSDESLSMILDLGCDVAQGYLISKPLRSDHLLDWIANYAPPMALDEDPNEHKGMLSLGA